MTKQDGAAKLGQLPAEVLQRICQETLRGPAGHELNWQTARLKSVCPELNAAAREVEIVERHQLESQLLPLGCALPTSPTLGLLRAAANFHAAPVPTFEVQAIRVVPCVRTDAIEREDRARVGRRIFGPRTFMLRSAALLWSTAGFEDRDLVWAAMRLPGLDDRLSDTAPLSFEYLASVDDGRYPDKFSGGRVFAKTLEKRRLVDENGAKVWAQVLIERTSGRELFRHRLTSEQDVIRWTAGGDGSLLFGASATSAHFLMWTAEGGVEQLPRLLTHVQDMSGRQTVMDPGAKWLMLLAHIDGTPDRSGDVPINLLNLKDVTHPEQRQWTKYNFPAPNPDRFYWISAEFDQYAALSSDFLAIRVSSHARWPRGTQAIYQENNILAWSLSGQLLVDIPFGRDGADTELRQIGLTLCHNILAVADNENHLSVSLFSLTTGQRLWRKCLAFPGQPLALQPGEKYHSNVSISSSLGAVWVGDGNRCVAMVHASTEQRGGEAPGPKNITPAAAARSGSGHGIPPSGEGHRYE